MNTNPMRKSTLAWRKLADEAVIIELESDRMFHQLNGVATFIWDLCDGKHTPEDMQKLMIEEYDISPESAQYDLSEFLTSLNEMKLLQ